MVSIRQAVLDADVLQRGHFVFADGGHAFEKLEIDALWEHPVQLAVILDHLAKAEGLPPADVMLGVPSGGQRLAIELAESGRLQIPIALLERVPGGAKQDFRFSSEADEKLVRHASSVRIYEDVVTTLSSIAGVVKLLNPDTQQVNSLSIWRRGIVKPEYQKGLVDHYLHEELMTSFSPEDCPYPGCSN